MTNDPSRDLRWHFAINPLLGVRTLRDQDRVWRNDMSWLFAPFAALLGVVLTTQVATNTQLGKALGNPYVPATVNMIIGFFTTVILTWSLTSEWPSREMVRAAPLYAWFAGGLMGVIYLTGTILLA